MAYESIDQSKEQDTFNRILSSCLDVIWDDKDDIEIRLKAESELKKYFKTDRPDYFLNLIIESIHANDRRRQEKETKQAHGQDEHPESQ